jgi:hypothetical protein
MSQACGHAPELRPRDICVLLHALALYIHDKNVTAHPTGRLMQELGRPLFGRLAAALPDLPPDGNNVIPFPATMHGSLCR